MTLLEKLGITPGPWERESTDKTENNLDELIKKNEKWVGWAYECYDARLIAQAPAMLEVLIEELTLMELYGDEGSSLIKVRTIIELATGKTWGEIKELMEETNG